MNYYFKVFKSFSLTIDTFIAAYIQITPNGDLLLLDTHDNIIRAFRKGPWTECTRGEQI